MLGRAASKAEFKRAYLAALGPLAVPPSRCRSSLDIAAAVHEEIEDAIRNEVGAWPV
jgi:hypothetical protein